MISSQHFLQSNETLNFVTLEFFAQ